MPNSEMNAEQMQKAMVEIANGKTGTPLERDYPEEYAELKAEIREIEREGYIVDIPPDVL